MKIISGILAASLTVCSLSAVASDWQWTTSSSSANYYLDFDSVATVGTHRKAWVKISYDSAQETSSYPKKQYLSSKSLYYFDCTSKLLGVTQTVNYEKAFTSGDVVTTTSVKFDPKLLDDVVPDTVGETILRTACASPAERAKVKAANKAKAAELLKKIEQWEKEEQNNPTAAPDTTTSGKTL